MRELHHRLGEALAVGDDHALRGVLDAPGAICERLALGAGLCGQRGEVDAVEAQEIGLLGLGEHEQVVDDARHPVDLVEDQRHCLAVLVGVVAEQLEVPADDRQRCAQLVTGVIDEPALRCERGLHPVEHRVEPRRELGDLIIADDGDPAAQVAVGDRLCRVAERPHRTQHTARQPPRQQRAVAPRSGPPDVPVGR